MKYTQTKWQYFGIPLGVFSGSAKTFLHTLLGQKYLFRIVLVLSPMKPAYGAIFCLAFHCKSAQYHYMRQIQGNSLGFQFCSFWYWDRDGEKMGKYELEHPSMDFLCHTVAPGVPLIYHIIS